MMYQNLLFNLYFIYIYIYIYYKFTSECHSQTTPSSEQRQLGPGNVFSSLCWQANPQLWHRVHKPPSLSINSEVKGIQPQQDKVVSHIYNFTSKCHSQSTPSSERRYRKPHLPNENLKVFSSRKLTLVKLNHFSFAWLYLWSNI